MSGLGRGNEWAYVAGTGGDVVVATRFTMKLAADAAPLAGVGSVSSSAVIRFDRSGALRSTAVLDANIDCDIRDVAMRGSDAVVTGISFGTADPILGACSVTTPSAQDPVEIIVDPQGNQTLAAHWAAGSSNAQGWRTAALADGTLAMAGIYGRNLTIGTPLPTASSNENAFVTRFTAGAPSPVWAAGLTANTVVQVGALWPSGNELCALGAFDGPSQLFGMPITNVGNFDAWIVRLDPAGTRKFLQTIGTPGDESSYGNGSIVATSDGGCIVSIDAPGDLTLGGVSLPLAAGPSILVRLDASGTIVAGSRQPSVAALALVGGRLYGALTVSAPLTIAGQVYTPQGSDVIIVELGDNGPMRLIGSVGGAGDQSVGGARAIAAVDLDAVALVFSSSGQLVFGTTTIDPGASQRWYVGLFDL